MITSFLLSMGYTLIGALMSVLPTGHLPSIMSTAFAYFLGVANTFSYIIPVGTLLQALVVVVAVDGAILVWHFANWIIRKIPGMQ